MRNARAILLLAALCACGPAQAQSAANGEALYNGACRACHGFPPAGGPDRAAGSPNVIRNAINSVGAMSFLGSVLSSSDLDDIAAYLLSLAAPRQPAVPAFDYTDLWWGGAAESGWGLNLIQHPSHVIFGVMYTYEASGRATWFVLPAGTWTSPTAYSGLFYRVTGPPFNGAVFDPGSVRVQQVGSAALTFTDRDNGTFAFTVDGVQVSKTISRQPF